MQYGQTRWVDVGIGIFDCPGGKPNNNSRQQVHCGIHQAGDDGDGARQGHCHRLGHKQQLKVKSKGSFNMMTNKATAIALVTNNSSLQHTKKKREKKIHIQDMVSTKVTNFITKEPNRSPKTTK